MAQTAIGWLEAAGVDCTTLKAKWHEIKKSHDSKTIGGKRHPAAKVPDRLLDSVCRTFVTSPLVIEALVDELKAEFSAPAKESG